jgi:acetyl-CoA acetyltransferase
MEMPYGSTLISNYAMVKHRHMHDYGSTDEQFAEISVATRYHAMRNPEAVKGDDRPPVREGRQHRHRRTSSTRA